MLAKEGSLETSTSPLRRGLLPKLLMPKFRRHAKEPLGQTRPQKWMIPRIISRVICSRRRSFYGRLSIVVKELVTELVATIYAGVDV